MSTLLNCNSIAPRRKDGDLTGSRKHAHILAIETSCDETAVAVLRQTETGLELLTDKISSQVKLHAQWGGVVPNLAAREHVKNLPHVLQTALDEAKISPAQIDLVSVTSGPGLIPALLTGVNFAKTLAYLWEKPLLGIHHIEGHIYANFIGGIKNQESRIKNKNHDSKFMIQNSSSIKFPILCLVVSGGHTQLVLMKDHLKYEVVGQTLDDAVGEAFDKVARILGIGYPGGPVVAAWAAKYQNPNVKFQTKPKCQNTKITSDQLPVTSDNDSNEKTGNTHEIKLPRPMINKQGFNFSFSGLKTAVLYETKKNPDLLKDEEYIAAVCHEFQQACVDVLVAKTLKAAEKYQPKTIMLAGGVSANKELRKQLGNAVQEFMPNTSYIIPDTSLTGDNAAMIATAAAFRWQKMSDVQKKKALSNWRTLQPDANLKLA